MKMMGFLPTLDFSHWLMASGALLLLAGLIGLAINKRKAARRDRLPDGLKGKGETAGLADV